MSWEPFEVCCDVSLDKSKKRWYVKMYGNIFHGYFKTERIAIALAMRLARKSQRAAEKALKRLRSRRAELAKEAARKKKK